MGINWDDTQKVTQAVKDMYNIHIFEKIQLTEWEDKEETNKTWGLLSGQETFWKHTADQPWIQ